MGWKIVVLEMGIVKNFRNRWSLTLKMGMFMRILKKKNIEIRKLSV